MNNRPNIVPLIIAAVLAVLAGIATFFYLTNTSAQANSDAQTKLAALGTQVQVVVPTTDISPGSKIVADQLATANRYQADIQGLTVYTDVNILAGKYASTWLYHGEPVIAQRVTDRAGETQVAELPSKQIPADKKAFALSITPDQAVGGLIGTGDYIDVYSSTTGLSALMFQNIHVLCISGQFPCGGSVTTAQSNSGAGFGNNPNTISGGVQSGGKILILDLDDGQIKQLTALLTSSGRVYVALHSSKK